MPFDTRPGFHTQSRQFSPSISLRFSLHKMGQSKKHRNRPQQSMIVPTSTKGVRSLLDVMEDGREYASLLGRAVELDAREEIKRALRDIEQIRGRPLLVYVANVVKPLVDTPVSINVNDDLPFSEM